MECGRVTVGVRVLDANRVETTEYVTREAYDELHQKLRDAEALADEWEDRYDDLLSRCGGTMP
jgi:hypothetical protein